MGCLRRQICQAGGSGDQDEYRRPPQLPRGLDRDRESEEELLVWQERNRGAAGEHLHAHGERDPHSFLRVSSVQHNLLVL